MRGNPVNHRMIAIALAALVALVATGCKQGPGERCQVNADCTTNLCSKSEPQVCVSSDDKDQADIDAEVPTANHPAP